MRVISGEVPSDGQLLEKTTDNDSSYEKKNSTITNGESADLKKLDVIEQKSRSVTETVNSNMPREASKERKSSGSEEDINSNTHQSDEKKAEATFDKANRVVGDMPERIENKAEVGRKTEIKQENNAVDELTTKVFRMRVSSPKSDRVDTVGVTNKLSSLSLKAACTQNQGTKSPTLKLVAKGPDGGKPTAYNQYNYGTSDWTAVQSNMRMKEASGKRGRDDEFQPLKYTRPIEPVESSDYSYPHQGLQTYSDQLGHPPGMYGYRMNNLNHPNKPQVTGWNMLEMTMPTPSKGLSGGSVTVLSPDSASRQIPPFPVQQMQQAASDMTDWDDGDDILDMLDDDIGNSMPAYGHSQQEYPYPLDPLPEPDPPVVILDDNNGGRVPTALTKQKRNPSGGDESGYDSEAMSIYSDSQRSPESVLGSPAAATTSNYSSHLNQAQYSPASNMASPLSVDSGHSMGSPASYQAISSPASQMSVGSPGSQKSAFSPAAFSPVHSPEMLGYDSAIPQESQAQAEIVAELQKPMPVSPVDKNAPLDLVTLKDLYDVIAKDLKDQQEKTIANKVNNPKSNPTINNAGSQPHYSPSQPAVATAPSNVIKRPSQPLPAPIVTTVMNPITVAPGNFPSSLGKTTCVGPVVLGAVPQTTATVIPQPPCMPGTQQPRLVQPVQPLQPGQNGPIVMPQPIVPVTSGQNIIWVPLNPMVAPSTGSILVIRPPPQNQKKGGPTKPRPILPKLPQVMPGKNPCTSTGTSSATSRTNSTTASLSTKTQTVPSNTPTVINNLTSEPHNSTPKMSAVLSSPSVPRMPMTNGNIPLVAAQMMSAGPPRILNGQIPQSLPNHPPVAQPFTVQGQMDGQTPNKLNLARRYVADMRKDELRLQDQDGDTYLHVAICKTDPCLVKAILERLSREDLLKVMIDQPNKKRQTPLYVAVAANHPVMVQELVRCGADPNCLAECQWNNGMRKEVKAAIHCAAQGGRVYAQTLYELLRSRDLNLNLANSEGLTAIHCAIQEHGKIRGDQVLDSIQTVELLIRAGADPNVQDKKSGKTPLMYAIETKDPNLVQAMVNLIDKDKLRYMLKTQTFDGSNCSKICSGLRMDSDVDGWKRINALILSASSGSDSRGLDTSPGMP